MSYEVWSQDIQNDSIYNRNISDWLSRANYLYNKNCNIYNQNFNTHTHNGIDVCVSHQYIRPINTESNLYRRGIPFLKDVLSYKDGIYMQAHAKESNKLLYKGFFSTGVNSICYPNIDTYQWDNVTKALYKTDDIRK